MTASRAKVVTSPREAAIGVATLSGLMLHLWDNTTTSNVMAPGIRHTIYVKIEKRELVSEK